MSHPVLSQRLSRLAAAALLCAAAASPAVHAQAAITDPPENHHFGKIPLNATYATQYFSVFNQGTEAITLGAVRVDASVLTCMALHCPTVAPEEFIIPSGSDGCSNQRLAPGAGCSTLVSFTPRAAGPRTALLVVPVTNGNAVTRPLNGTGTTQPLDCVLDWAEAQYPAVLTSPTPTFQISPFYARCYANNSICVGADNLHPTFDQPSVYIYSPAAHPAPQNIGYLSAWAQQAQCR